MWTSGAFVRPLMEQQWEQQLQQQQRQPPQYLPMPLFSPSLGWAGPSRRVAGPMPYTRFSGVERCCFGRREFDGMGEYFIGGQGGQVGTRSPTIGKRFRYRRRSLRGLPPASSSTPTPTPPLRTPVDNDESPAEGEETASVGREGRMSPENLESGSTREEIGPLQGEDEGQRATRPETSGGSNDTDGSDSGDSSSGGFASTGRSSDVKCNAGGRIRLKWGLDVDVSVPLALESLVKGPWNPEGNIWRSQVNLAAQVIERSGGVVFMEQLAPILNPREAPPAWYRETAAGSFSRGADTRGFITVEAVGGEATVLKLLLDLNGTPEVTSDGDILYVFPGLADRSMAPTSRATNAVTVEEFEADQLDESGGTDFTVTTEVLQFEEVPGLLEALPNILPDQGPKVVKEFFQRAALAGFALFLTTCLLLGQLIFHYWPTWLATGPAYLIWVGLDDTLKRSRDTSAKQRDRWRREWADVCRGDGDVVWRKRAAARLRARQLRDGGG